MAEKSFKDGETLKAEELDPAYVDLAKPTKLVKEVCLTSSISLQKRP